MKRYFIVGTKDCEYIFGVGISREGALKDAEIYATENGYNAKEFVADLKVYPCTPELYQEVFYYGSVPFTFDKSKYATLAERRF
jgi:hypothetical protein